MSEVSANVQQMEKTIADIKDAIKLRDLVLRLDNNPDFKRLINDEFLVKECARYAQNSANPALGAVERADSLGIAQAAGHLKRFLSVTIQKGNHAASQLPEYESALDEMRGEEA